MTPAGLYHRTAIRAAHMSLGRRICMFTLNNPVNMVDPTGHVPTFMTRMTDSGSSWYGNDKSKIEVATHNWMMTNDETYKNKYIEECNDEGKDETVYEIEEYDGISKAFKESLTIDIGTRAGLGGSTIISELLNLSGVIKGDAFHLKYENGQWLPPGVDVKIQGGVEIPLLKKLLNQKASPKYELFYSYNGEVKK